MKAPEGGAMRLSMVVLLIVLSGCATQGAPRVDCRGPLRPVNAALLKDAPPLARPPSSAEVRP